MAMIYCRECGKQISDQAPACPNCGAPQQPQMPTYPVNMTYPMYVVKPKIPGRGFAISSMVLGIIAAVYALIYSIGAIEIIIEGDSYYRTISEKLENGNGYIVIATILSILALSFAIASHSKGCVLKQKTAGTILGIISIVIPIAILVTGLSISK